ncbi:MAG: hypothetical protein GXO79_06330 [Chlorobi bacterium]|nr:hypothetical protein [Chlorobiota bacterium]
MNNIFRYIILSLFLFSGCSLIKEMFPPSPENILRNNDFNWEKDSSDNFYYYFETNSTASNKIGKIKSFLESNYADLLKLNGINLYQPKIKFFMLESKEKMELLFGYKTNGKSIPKDNATYSVIGKKTNALAMHEICHIISNNVLGDWSESWINEGLAVYSDNDWHGYNLHQLSNYFLEKDKIISFKELFNNMGSYNSLISYPEAGSIVKYIYEKYGLEAIKILWKEGSESMRKATGVKLEDLESEWKEEIKKFSAQNVKYNRVSAK